MNDGLKALVMIVAIGAVVGVAVYIFDEIKKAKIQQAKAEAVAGAVKGSAEMLRGFIPRG